ncbi:MAG: hypothetical protein WA924_07500, partial [Burkholderiaceae bacterium]
MSNYFLGQGRLDIAARTAAGLPKALRWLGDVSEAKLSLTVESVKHKESHTGQRMLAKNIPIGKEAVFDFTPMELSRENLAMTLSGTSTTVAQGTVTAEALPDGLVAGDKVALKYPQVSDVVITDSSVTPATVDSSKYEVNATYGTITIKDVAGLTQPLKVAYTHEAVDSVSVFTAAQSEIFVRYEGINLAEGGAPIIVELYKVATEPLKELALITTAL